MRTLASELGEFAGHITEVPRVYADANVPAGVVRFMRDRLKWNVFFVMEEEDLRRAADIAHFHLARQLRRTLLTLDHDYLDDKLFPCGSCGGVVVLSAPDEHQCRRLLNRIDRALFRSGSALPLLGRKLHVHTDWTGELSRP
jgi:Domain of unknown function (DUF5615)